MGPHAASDVSTIFPKTFSGSLADRFECTLRQRRPISRIQSSTVPLIVDPRVRPPLLSAQQLYQHCASESRRPFLSAHLAAEGDRRQALHCQAKPFLTSPPALSKHLYQKLPRSPPGCPPHSSQDLRFQDFQCASRPVSRCVRHRFVDISHSLTQVHWVLRSIILVSSLGIVSVFNATASRAHLVRHSLTRKTRSASLASCRLCHWISGGCRF